MDEIKKYARSLGSDDRCDGFGKNSYYRVIDYLATKYPESAEYILDNGEMLYKEYCEGYGN